MPDPDMQDHGARHARSPLPVAWDDRAAAALAVLAPGAGPRVAGRGGRGLDPPDRRAGRPAPASRNRWPRACTRCCCPAAARRPPRCGAAKRARPGFVLNLAAFHDPGHGFELAAFIEAVDTATLALALHAPSAERIAVGMADLAGLLAALGLPYDSAARPRRGGGAGRPAARPCRCRLRHAGRPPRRRRRARPHQRPGAGSHRRCRA